MQSIYSNYVEVFSFHLAIELPENISIYKYAIKLVIDKYLDYEPIYTLSLVELEILNTYIETHLETRFIRSLLSPTDTPILSDKKLNDNLYLCINYWGLNNLRINNKYPLLLIGKSLNWLNQVKQFTQLDLIYAYHWMKIWGNDE